MLARIRKARENEGGFTLIELLVVMIIIGILAAIAIPVFLSQRAKAQDSAAKADISTIGKEIATYYVDGVATDADGAPKVTIDAATGHYVLNVAAVVGPPTALAIVNQDLGKASTNNVVPAGAQFFAGNDKWCVSIQNPKGDKAKKGYTYSAANGLSEGQCTSAAG
jgi:prepilin-type N-terminal cleavage/methylation domain-containing protein